MRVSPVDSLQDRVSRDSRGIVNYSAVIRRWIVCDCLIHVKRTKNVLFLRKTVPALFSFGAIELESTDTNRPFHGDGKVISLGWLLTKE